MLLQPAFFLARRLLLACTVCLIKQTLVMQIMLMAFQIITSVIILGENVFRSKAQRNLEYFNETVLMFTMYTIFFFSPWVAQSAVRFMAGYITIIVVSLHLLINLFVIARSTVRDTHDNLRRKMAIRRHRAQRLALRRRLEDTFYDRRVKRRAK